MYGIGAWVVVGSMTQAVVLGGVVALLLQLREPLHQFAGKIGEQDIKAIMQLVLIALVILPLLPDRTFRPYGVPQSLSGLRMSLWTVNTSPLIFLAKLDCLDLLRKTADHILSSHRSSHRRDRGDPDAVG